MPKPILANQLGGTSGDDTLDRRGYSDNWTIDGRGGNDVLYGGSGEDNLIGGRGDDLIYASLEDIAVNGGAGVDTVSFLYSGTGAFVGLDGGAVYVLPYDPINPPLRYVLSGVENAIGSNYDDHLQGSRAVNHLDGGAGNDILEPRGTGDFLTGGTGADSFSIQSASKTVTVTDFHYNEGDRLVMDSTPELSWLDGWTACPRMQTATSSRRGSPPAICSSEAL
jgi:Ca2+-binding RTX toxin-like protein